MTEHYYTSMRKEVSFGQWFLREQSAGVFRIHLFNRAYSWVSIRRTALLFTRDLENFKSVKQLNTSDVFKMNFFILK